MDGSESPAADRRPVRPNGSGPRHRRESMRSSMSVVSDVEMAQEEVFSGPMSESIPSSVASFAHRGMRHGSVVSFSYLREDDDSFEHAEDEEAVEDEVGISPEFAEGTEHQLDFPVPSSKSRRSLRSRDSIEEPLLSRRDSVKSHVSGQKVGGRISQKVYLVTEDLTIVIAGFSTRMSGYAAYLILCILTFGIAYLVFRWAPKLRLRLVGKPSQLRECQWVAIEDQWNRLAVLPVRKTQYGRPLSTVFGAQQLLHTTSELEEDNDPIMSVLRSLDYRYLQFFYHPLEDKFVLVTSWKDPLWTNVKVMRNGLDADERDSREQVFGQNLIGIEEKSVAQLLVDEAFHPFYVFQIASLILWSLDEYYYYAACIFIVSIFSIGATILETRSTMNRLREISHFECDVRVLRNGFWRSVSSGDLVPGDVFEVSDPSLTEVPCDCLLLSGDCIINESMLTGESVPVSKSPVTDDALEYFDLNATSIHPVVAKHFLFCGTRIVRARRPQGSDDDAVALAIVIRTGFSTTKGALVRSMLFPKPSGFKFYRDSFRYIAVMGLIAVLGFIASFVNFIRLGLSWRVIIIRALDLITIVVPPALPATLTIGTNFALSRLKKQSIFCISPQRVNVGGKLDVVCFDKTGTLTEDGLDVLGVRAVTSKSSFTEILCSPSQIYPSSRNQRDTEVDYHKRKQIIYTMATCHSLRVVDDELLGDPLDVKMFEFTGWSYEEGGNARRSQEDGGYDETITPSIAKPPAGYDGVETNETPLELGVLRSFEFVSHLRRTSVIVRQFGDSGVSVFVKGAPECMRDICIPETIPCDFDEVLSGYTHRGYRVIACAAKYERKLSWMKVQKMSRSDAESGLEFLGFIVFENKLKSNTAAVISELKQANIRNVMCTGDNILTAVSVARECRLIDPDTRCYIPRFIEGDGLDAQASLGWESIDDPSFTLDGHTLMPATPVDSSVPYVDRSTDKYCVAVSGDVFRWLVDFGSEELLKRVLVRGQVFARMSPDEKHELVEKLQSLDYTCGFCGDGANDCGALKAADVGISLSDAEASVAAPFTSRVFDISCVPKVIKEGRAALVTSFSCFKYMSLYSAIQFTSVSFLYTSASNLGDFQFLFIDLVLILPIAVFMGWTGPYPTLSRKRPTADLVSRKVLTPLLGQIVICVLAQFAIFKAVQSQPWFIPPKIGKDSPSIENSEDTALFLLSCFQYILTSVVLSVGPPFRQPIISNVPFLLTVTIDALVSAYMLFGHAEWLTDIMQLTFMSLKFKGCILALAIGQFLLSWIAEKRIFPALAQGLWRVYLRLRPNYRKPRRQYKVVLEQMQT
ncbi:hypothetical protein DTO164E3_2189 [Paecilomyces variotii]|nr:hypothetical protein DTO164E3_2189 [Paecilomyces variotii]KAJ9225741.1 hypothetical protein DTO169C6_1804 [Paecilomyces variotii]KAJ9252788.1 hypothetical protein DTO207G8_4574 [Paecilomyces variotii]KAJ9262522.1 hypothetical protein DTO195F2_3570 [Paecilomyces variotii]KAJ9324976.1 hypothetical protein DTO027B3_4108 [Paecilomyces variotii]